MEVNRSFIGTATEPFIIEVEKGAIRNFADALGETNPLYYDEAFARANGYAGLLAPPTFPVSFRPPVRQAWLRDLDEGRILAGEQTFKYVRPVVAGDVLECRLHLVAIEEKQGKSGSMELLFQELRALDSKGQLVVTNGRMTIYRSAGALKSR